ncbi:hypothetical protein BB560_004545 [Smittium megazygosporum]|uniref:CAP-Gly domain-containing protein n=1 Tax=Smittium megazygosporum TaxID=133381 RepID=A0A2T9Z8Y0_9FUNG|nr:hypothetical protein BB560_004545 [Smittium megazygosporum]
MSNTPRYGSTRPPIPPATSIPRTSLVHPPRKSLAPPTTITPDSKLPKLPSSRKSLSRTNNLTYTDLNHNSRTIIAKSPNQSDFVPLSTPSSQPTLRRNNLSSQNAGKSSTPSNSNPAISRSARVSNVLPHSALNSNLNKTKVHNNNPTSLPSLPSTRNISHTTKLTSPVSYFPTRTPSSLSSNSQISESSSHSNSAAVPHKDFSQIHAQTGANSIRKSSTHSHPDILLKKEHLKSSKNNLSSRSSTEMSQSSLPRMGTSSFTRVSITDRKFFTKANPELSIITDLDTQTQIPIGSIASQKGNTLDQPNPDLNGPHALSNNIPAEIRDDIISSDLLSFNLKVGDTVFVENINERGTLRYLGEIASKTGIWAGVELDRHDKGKNDGTALG